MTKAERRHYDRLARMGCIVCLNMGYEGGEIEIHHTKIGITGAGRKSDWRSAIPLCVSHHRQGKLAYHTSPRTFEECYGTQQELLAQVTERLGIPAWPNY